MNYKLFYTDGSAIPNPGRGGWAVYDVLEKTLESGYLENVTNNYCELYAVYRALIKSTSSTRVFVYTDSRVVVGWLAKGWARNSEHIDSLVTMIFETIIALSLDVRYVKVKGHWGVQYNELVDSEARRQATNLTAR